MGNETEASNKIHYNSSDTFDLGLRQDLELESLGNEFCTREKSLRSADKRNKEANGSFRRRVHEFCALAASRTELESIGNSEATSSRRDNTSASTSDNRHTKQYLNIQSNCPIPINQKQLDPSANPEFSYYKIQGFCKIDLQKWLALFSRGIWTSINFQLFVFFVKCRETSEQL